MEIKNSLFSLFEIGISIHQINRASEKKFGLSLAQWSFLMRLVNLPAVSAHHLSASVGVHPSTLTQSLKRLEKKKMIFVTEDPKDSRKKIISISRFGKERLDQVTKQFGVLLGDLPGMSQELSRMQVYLKQKTSGAEREPAISPKSI